MVAPTTVVIEITSTPRETLLWFPSADSADDLRGRFSEASITVLKSDHWEMDFFGRIPDLERAEFDPARIIDVEIGENAFRALELARAAGHELRWHPWQPIDGRGFVWGCELSEG
jgi:hypothetical protein